LTDEGNSPVVARVVCIDDDTLIREGLRTLAKGVAIVGTFETVEEFLDARPVADVVLLDLSLGGTGRRAGLQGGAAVKAVAAQGYAVLLYTNERRREVLIGCLAAGARGVVHKAEPIVAVEAAAQSVAAGEVVVTDAIAGLVELANHRSAFASLTARELDVLRGRARGESFTSIGNRLFITPKTAQEYMANVTAKFGEYLRSHSPADLERHLGFAPGDLLDWSQ
jgi:two-component system nitrate/nitrite response regulator NarL